MTAEKIVQKNLNSYNERNIETFVLTISDDIELFEFGQSKPSISGLVAVKNFYGDLFSQSPELHSTILKRIVLGNTVIDHESIIGRNGASESIELVLVYETRDNKIFRITVIRG